MIKNKKVIVILPAYNAAVTLRKTYEEIPFDIVDDVILTDDASTDETLNEAHGLGIKHIFKHERNLGYGANQKTCYRKALELKGDIIIMLHPDYQYSPKLIPSMAYLIASEAYGVVLGSRILGNGALKGGMPLYKYAGNRALTFFQNLLCGAKLSEYHTGYRAFSSDVLRKIDIMRNDDGFVFDNQLLSQIIYAGYDIAEITCPTKYFKEASSINFWGCLKYGAGVMRVTIEHAIQRTGLIQLNRYKGL
jgi:glycosyltransferase involved in cell wall biosynthesis